MLFDLQGGAMIAQSVFGEKGEGSTAAPRSAAARRRLGFILLALLLLLCAAAYGLYWMLWASHHVSTDNAYTAVEVAQVTPSVGGIISAVHVVDTQHVKKGDLMLEIDDTDLRLSLTQAQADYELAIRKVRGLQANDAALSSQITAREADERRAVAQLESARSDFERVKLDFKRREGLLRSGSVSQEEFTRIRSLYAMASAALRAAEAAAAQARASREAAIAQRDANRVYIDEAEVENNPQVVLARARRDQARVDLARTRLRAPVSGVVAKRQVQVGQRIAAGTTLLSIVPLQAMHVDANFKEGQLAQVREGQVVELHADRYGSQVTYQGVVAGFSGGTGSAFAVIPAQNATGNWIKVVQRLPVRILLRPEELAAHPLQVGLSMQVSIDTRSLDNRKSR